MYLINFPTYLNSEVFENKLKLFSLESKNNSEESILFNLESTRWCDPYALCLILLSTQSLKNNGFKTEIKLPTFSLSEIQQISEKSADTPLEKKIRFFSFLVQSRFIEILNNLELTHNITDTSVSDRSPKKIDSLISPFLMWSSWNSFKEFVNALNSPEQYELFYNNVLRYRIVSSGKMRDIIFKELGDNIFEHANGKTGVLVMNKGVSPEFGIPHWEKPFFHKLGKTEYLEIVIADLGKGIFNTLKQRYKELEGKSGTNSEVMEYALQQYTTKKTVEERLKKLTEVLKSRNELEVLPATGLYWVKDVAREFNALLTIRSKSSILIYDFLNHQNQIKPQIIETLKINHKLLKLSRLEGVQIKLCFPISRKQNLSQAKMLNIYDSDKIKSYHVIRLKSFFNASTPDDLNAQAEPLLKLLNTIENEKQKIPQSKVLVIDFDAVFLSNKTFFILGIELMRIQNSNFIIIPVNADHLISIQNQFAEFCSQTQVLNSNATQKENALLSFDSELNQYLLGLDKEVENKIFNFIESTSSIDSNLEKELFKNVRHLLHQKGIDEIYVWSFSFEEIKKLINQSLVESISNFILNPEAELDSSENNYEIFHSERWFLIPSQSYCFGFFEIGKLLAHQQSKEKIIKWIKSKFKELKPQIIISIGGNEQLSFLQDKFNKEIEWIHVDDPEDPKSWIKLAFIEKDKRTLILTDVLGTGTTLKKTIERLSTKENINILTIVDSRKDDQPDTHIRIDGTNYNISSVLRFPIRFENDLPEGCTYQDIIVIDTVSKSPIWSLPYESEPIWNNFDTFLEEVITPSNSLMSGHFEAGDKHILYLFLTSQIADYFKESIVDRMRKDIQNSYQQMKIPQPRINAIFYPEQSFGSDKIAFQFSSLPEFLGSTICAISVKMLNNPVSYSWSQPHPIKDVVIFDDATSSGTTVEKMIDIAENWGAEIIFVYILFNRCNSYQTRLLEKKKGYGKSKVEVRFLTNANIPIYNADKCPVCLTIKELEETKHFKKDNEAVLGFLENKIESLKSYPIEFIWNNLANPFFRIPNVERSVKRGKYRRMLQLGLENNPQASNSLARLIRKGLDKDILLLFQVIAKEKNIFYLTNSKAKQLFYPEFRKDLIKKARKIYFNPIKLKPKEFDATVNIIRIFDEDIFFADLEKLIEKASESEDHLLVIISNFLLSRKSQRQPKLIDNLILKHYPQLLSNQLNLFPIYPLSEDISVNNITTNLFEEVLRMLHPSAGPNIKFESLLYDISCYFKKQLSIEELVKNVERQWKEIRKQLQIETIPKLNELAEIIKRKKLSFAVVDELYEHLNRISSYLQATDELFEVVNDVNEVKEDETLKLFSSYLQDLQVILCSDEKGGSIHYTICQMTCEIRQTVRKCLEINKTKGLIDDYSIDYILNLPEEGCYVFCHEGNLVQIVENLINNLKHAFNEKSSVIKAEINISTQEDYVRFTVKDSGNTGIFPFEPSVGLQEVQSIVSAFDGKYYAPKQILEDDYKTVVGFDLKIISEELIS